MLFAVAGVTGQTGSAVADTLLERGDRVRAIVHSSDKGEVWRLRGAEVAIADLSDADAVARALTGVDGAYLLVPPQYHADDLLHVQRKIVDALVAGARRSGVQRVVLLSSGGAQHRDGTGPIRTLHALEQAFANVQGDITIVRAAYFIENTASVAGVIKDKHVLPTFIPAGVRFPMISTRDIGRIAAELLTDGQSGRRLVNIAGPQDYSHADLAAAASQLLGTTVNAVDVPVSQVEPTFTSLGVSPDAARLFREMYEGAINGKVTFEPGPVVRGRITPVEALRPLLR
jgi:uncharacterized protein YbjT (DUF2867 family)